MSQCSRTGFFNRLFLSFRIISTIIITIFNLELRNQYVGFLATCTNKAHNSFAESTFAVKQTKSCTNPLELIAYFSLIVTFLQSTALP
jgi:hypothetical protein